MDGTTGLRVIARFLDGRLLKGVTHDFSPQRLELHVTPHSPRGARPVEVPLAKLKALFFAKSWDGDPQHVDDNSFRGAVGHGRRVVVTFRDGERLAGFTVSYTPDKPGFFVIPADSASNNARVFVVSSAVKKLEWVGAPDRAVAGGARTP